MAWRSAETLVFQAVRTMPLFEDSTHSRLVLIMEAGHPSCITIDLVALGGGNPKCRSMVGLLFVQLLIFLGSTTVSYGSGESSQALGDAMAMAIAKMVVYPVLIALVLLHMRRRAKTRDAKKAGIASQEEKESVLCRALAASVFIVYAIMFIAVPAAWPELGWMLIPFIAAMIWVYRYLPTPKDIRTRLIRHLSR